MSYLKGLKQNISLFQPLLAAKAKLKRPIPCSPMGMLSPINFIWPLLAVSEVICTFWPYRHTQMNLYDVEFQYLGICMK